MSNSGSNRGSLQSQRVSCQSQSGREQVQVLRMMTRVRIWVLLLNAVEYPQDPISITPVGIEANLKKPCSSRFFACDADGCWSVPEVAFVSPGRGHSGGRRHRSVCRSTRQTSRMSRDRHVFNRWEGQLLALHRLRSSNKRQQAGI